MQDIDFDEIDRAVSSVNNTGTEPVTPPISDPVVNPVQPSQSMASTPEVSSPAARRSTGRFMDVVHSSSDMRPTRSEAPVVPAARPAEMPRETVAPREEPTIAPTAQTSGAAFHWPDPIDTHESKSEPTVEDLLNAVPVVEPVLAAEEPVVLPLESPFLTDAKVEKRPLGAFSGADAELPLLEDFPVVAEVSSPQPTVSTEIEETPAELNDDVLKLEYNNQEEVGTEVAETPTLQTFFAPVVTTVEDVPVGPTSITQQYQEQPSTANDVSGAIFDTEAYHQPLVPPVKKKSAVLIVVWALALVVVGGGIGATIYFVVLPMLG